MVYIAPIFTKFESYYAIRFRPLTILFGAETFGRVNSSPVLKSFIPTTILEFNVSTILLFFPNLKRPWNKRS